MWTEAAVAYFKVRCRHSPGATEERHETVSQDSRCSYQYMNRTLLEYKPRSCNYTNLLGARFNACLVLSRIAYNSCNKLYLNEASNKQGRWSHWSTKIIQNWFTSRQYIIYLSHVYCKGYRLTNLTLLKAGLPVSLSPGVIFLSQCLTFLCFILK
jgi:hypothetical protein